MKYLVRAWRAFRYFSVLDYALVLLMYWMAYCSYQ